MQTLAIGGINYALTNHGRFSTLCSAVAWAEIVPFILWNVLMGFVIYNHHTHPRVAWFARREEWSFYEGQIRSPVHLELPFWFNNILHHIMEHTAHHIDINIPLYRLKAAQDRVEALFGKEIVKERWTWTGHLDHVRRCKLYDYERHRWLDFDGNETARVSVSRKSG
jgi:omega-6 fatty acid desaturase (delta-12 desaturase)